MQSGRVGVTIAVGLLLLAAAAGLEAQVPAATQDAITPADCLGEPSKAPLCQAQGLLHVAGTGVPQDVGKGLALLDAACRAGLASGCRQHGWYLLKLHRSAEDVERGAAILQTACAAREADACSVLGSAYASAIGVARDVPKAVDLLGQACELGQSWACTALAGLLSSGEGVERDPARALALLTKGCELGSAAACEKLRPKSAVRVGGMIREPRKLLHVSPQYPVQARTRRIQGTVRLECIISTDGAVSDVHAIEGPPELIDSAIEAVRKWRYEPTLLNGVPVPVLTTVTVRFRVS